MEHKKITLTLEQKYCSHSSSCRCSTNSKFLRYTFNSIQFIYTILLKRASATIKIQKIKKKLCLLIMSWQNGQINELFKTDQHPKKVLASKFSHLHDEPAAAL